MGAQWRYSLDKNLQQPEIIAEIVANAITRIEALEGKDSNCVLAEYKEWLEDNFDFDNDVISLRKITLYS